MSTDMRMNVIKLKPVVAALVMSVLMPCPLYAQPNVAELLMQLQKAEKAKVPELERALLLEWSKSGSTALDLLLRRGERALNEGDLSAAIDHLSALTDHAPDFAHGWYMRATAYAQVELLGPALEDLERVLALNPEHFEAIFALGTLMTTLERFDLAEKAFQKVLDLHPHHENAIKGLKQLHSLAGERAV